MSSDHSKNRFITNAYRWILKYGIPLFALAVISLNVSLIFDNVVWGDEAFSGNIIRGVGFAGIYQKVYYWDSHPPLYYFYLRIWTWVLGDHTWVLHLASVVPFAGGVVLALTYIRKKVGTIPAAFYLLITGLSATCAEYNQEIRMYNLCFLFILFAAYFSYRLIEKPRAFFFWAGLVLSGVAAAYTHYYGLVTSGLLLFVTGVAVFVKNKGKSWLLGVGGIAAYLLLYAPWLRVLFLQIMYVEGSWWMDHPDGPMLLIDFVFGGGHLKYIFLAFVVLVSIAAVVVEVLDAKKERKGLSEEVTAMCIFWATIALTVTFAYVASAVFKPILVNRYMHPIIPLVLFAMMAAIARIIRWGAEGVSEEALKDEEAGDATAKEVPWLETELKAVKCKRGRIVVIALAVAWFVLLVPALLDFKYYRSVSRSENLYTEQTLALVGEPSEDVIFTSLGVQHLAWTVLQYYYPDNEVYNLDPTQLEDEPDEIWAFMGYEMSEENLGIMKARGYKYSYYPNGNVAKYPCRLYHFTKTGNLEE